MRILKLIFCGLPLFLTYSLTGQFYTGDVRNEPFIPLTGGTNLVNESWDDPAMALELGFDFDFFGTPADSIFMSDTIGLGGVLVLNPDRVNNRVDLIFAFWPDLMDRGYYAGMALSPILGKVDGAPGQRVFTMEWRNTGFYNCFTDNQNICEEYINLQLRLYESDGSVEIHFGETVVESIDLYFLDPPGLSIGVIDALNPANTNLSEGLFVAGNPDNPQFIDITSYNQVPSLNNTIPEGTVYRFSPILSSLQTLRDVQSISYFTPNPTRGELNRRPGDLPDFDQCTVVDMVGREVMRFTPQQIINIRGLQTGTYTLVLEGEAGVFVDRIVKL